MTKEEINTHRSILYNLKYHLFQLKWAVTYRYPPRAMDSPKVVRRLDTTRDLLAWAIGSKDLSNYYDEP